MRRALLASILTIGLAAPAGAVPISQLPNNPNAAASMTDAVPAESSTCTGGDCRVTVQQIVNAVLANAGTFTAKQTVMNNAPSAFNNDYSLFVAQVGPTSGQQIYWDAIKSNPNCTSGCTAADALRGVATAVNGSTTASVNAVAAYILNQNVNANNGGNGVALFATGISAVDGAETWGINMNVEDSTVPFQVSSGGICSKDTPHGCRQLLNEFDFNVTNSHTQVNGLILQGASVAQPAIANGFVVGNLSLGYMNGDANASSVPWSAAFVTEPSAAIYGLQLGTRTAKSGANLSSQYVGLQASDASGNMSYAYFDNTPNGIEFSTTLLPVNDSSASFGSPSKNWLEMWTNRTVLKPTTLSGLPGCSYTYLGALGFITDSQSTTNETNAQGGGVYHVPVFCDGAEWVVL